MPAFIDNLLQILGNGATAAAFLAAIGYFFKDNISQRIASKLDLKNRERLAKLESELFAEQAAVNDLRQLVSSGALARNEKLIEKQIVGAETLWCALVDNKKHTMLLEFLKVIKVEEVNKHVQDGSVKDFIDATAKITGIEKLIAAAVEKANGPEEVAAAESANLASRVRPFVSTLSWALYQAHSAISTHAVVTIISWKHGMTTDLLKNEELVSAAVKALPHQKDFLEKFGVTGAYYLTEELEEALLKELKRFLQSGDSDTDALKQAQAILEDTKSIKAALKEQPAEIL